MVCTGRGSRTGSGQQLDLQGASIGQAQGRPFELGVGLELLDAGATDRLAEGPQPGPWRLGRGRCRAGQRCERGQGSAQRGLRGVVRTLRHVGAPSVCAGLAAGGGVHTAGGMTMAPSEPTNGFNSVPSPSGSDATNDRRTDALVWRAAGPEGAALRAAAAAAPGWYWVQRPRAVGPGCFDGAAPVQLPIWIGPALQVQSPLTDLRDLSAEALCPIDVATGASWETLFAGPILPGAPSGSLVVRPDGPPDGAGPVAAGWWWCRTVGPLMHVDPDGIGPIFLMDGEDGRRMVYAAATAAGRGVDLIELGFAEPLVARWGLIDAQGEAGRTEAHFYGPIALPAPAAPEQPRRLLG